MSKSLYRIGSVSGIPSTLEVSVTLNIGAISPPRTRSENTIIVIISFSHEYLKLAPPVMSTLFPKKEPSPSISKSVSLRRGMRERTTWSGATTSLSFTSAVYAGLDEGAV